MYNCFQYGLCHPMLLNGLFCPLIALAQVMIRMKLNSAGLRGHAHQVKNTYRSAVLLSFSFIILNALLCAIFWYGFVMIRPWLQITLAVVLNGSLFGYLVFVTGRTRSFIRRRYTIPEERCIGCEDVCVSTLCSPCVVMQMGRHTGNYETYRGACFTNVSRWRRSDEAVVHSLWYFFILFLFVSRSSYFY
mmetsp:Transcript_38026/g.57881  ORF Transcript_38026/g.57881 Transcript_38026/m.57881 type:complete len:190 (-) Transcript_38026:433-1002(-)